MVVLGVSISVKALLSEFNRLISDAVPLRDIPLRSPVKFPWVVTEYAGAKGSDFAEC
jgi:hypothetical protein